MNHTLQDKRKEIDDIDQQIITLLSQRLGVCAEIFEIKQQQKLDMRDRKREELLVQTLMNTCNDAALIPFIPLIFKGISEACYQYQVGLQDQRQYKQQITDQNIDKA
jgi:chorismate mutase